MQNRLKDIATAIETLEVALKSEDLLDLVEKELNVNVRHSLLVTNVVLTKAKERYASQVREILRANECVIKYIKADGTEKTAYATRGEAVNDKREDVVSYWDTEINQIRAFNINRLISIDLLKGA